MLDALLDHLDRPRRALNSSMDLSAHAAPFQFDLKWAITQSSWFQVKMVSIGICRKGRKRKSKPPTSILAETWFDPKFLAPMQALLYWTTEKHGAF
jgi:hypothetical protein